MPTQNTDHLAMTFAAIPRKPFITELVAYLEGGGPRRGLAVRLPVPAWIGISFEFEGELREVTAHLLAEVRFTIQDVHADVREVRYADLRAVAVALGFEGWPL